MFHLLIGAHANSCRVTADICLVFSSIRNAKARMQEKGVNL